MQAFRGFCSNSAGIHIGFLNTVRSEVPSAVTVSWDVTPCNLINFCQRSEGTCFIRQYGGRRLLRNTEKIYQTTPCRIPKYFFFNCHDSVVEWPTCHRNPRPVRAGVMVHKVALGWGFLFLIFRFSRVRIIPVLSHNHSSITDATESAQLTASLNNKHSC
jgi:hypothetical protein